MAREFIVPGRIISGTGALETAKTILKKMGKKALIVTDKVMVELGNCAKAEQILAEEGIADRICSESTGAPTASTSEKG